VAATITAATSTASSIGRGIKITVTAVFACLPGHSKEGKQATHMLTMTLHADYIISVLMADQEFKFRFAVRAIILVQWHRMYPPISRE
jgi:hypothetical protein